MIVASASTSMATSGSGGSSPFATSDQATESGTSRSVRINTVARTFVSERCGATRSARSWSANSTTLPESASPYVSSGPVHHALSGTATAPIAWTAQKAIAYSG